IQDIMTIEHELACAPGGHHPQVMTSVLLKELLERVQKQLEIFVRETDWTLITPGGIAQTGNDQHKQNNKRTAHTATQLQNEFDLLRFGTDDETLPLRMNVIRPDVWIRKLSQWAEIGE